MDISCAFPTTLESPEHVALAEELGFERAWLYDTPQQSPDVWMALALAAQRTARIGVGPGVLVPSLRHPMVNAAATAALEALATVLDDGEDHRSPRVRAAAGPGLALAYHGAYEFNAPLSELPGGTEWQAVIEATAPEERHLAVHAHHCVGLNQADEAGWDAGGYAMLEQATVSGTADQLRARFGELAAAGVTELVYQPCGPDIRRELETFTTTARPAVAA